MPNNIVKLSVMKIEHPKWSKILIIPGILFCIGVAIIPVLIFFMEGMQSYRILILTPASLLFAYMAFLGFDLYSYRNVGLEITDDSNFMIFSDSQKSTKLSGEDVSYKLMNRMQLIYFYNKMTGEKLAVFDHIFPNCKNVIDWVHGHLTCVSRGRRGARRP